MSGDRPPEDRRDAGRNRDHGQASRPDSGDEQPRTQGGPPRSQGGPPGTGPARGGQGPGGPGGTRGPAGGQGTDDESAVGRAAAATDADLSEWLSLETGEEVVWVGEPTKMQMVGTAATAVLLIPFLIGLLILPLLPVSYIGIKHTDYVVTNRSLYVKKGILSTNVESVGLDRIQNTEFTQSFWGTQFGYGTVEVSTAGSSGADISFSGVEDAREVRDVVSRVQREFSGGGDRGAPAGTGGGRESGPASDDRVDELVSELRATREALERVAAQLDDGDGDGQGDVPDDRETGRPTDDRSGREFDRQ